MGRRVEVDIAVWRGGRRGMDGGRGRAADDVEIKADES